MSWRIGSNSSSLVTSQLGFLPPNERTAHKKILKSLHFGSEILQIDSLRFSFAFNHDDRLRFSFACNQDDRLRFGGSRRLGFRESRHFRGRRRTLSRKCEYGLN